MKVTATTPVATFFHPDSQIVLKELTDTESGVLFKALATYTESGIIPQFEERIMRLAFNLFMVNIDRKREAYQQRCEQNRRIAQQREEQRKQQGTNPEGEAPGTAAETKEQK